MFVRSNMIRMKLIYKSIYVFVILISLSACGNVALGFGLEPTEACQGHIEMS